MIIDNYLELEKYAQDNGYNSLEFTVIAKNFNTLKFVFLDAYMGLVRMYNEDDTLADGFFMLSELDGKVLKYIVEK